MNALRIATIAAVSAVATVSQAQRTTPRPTTVTPARAELTDLPSGVSEETVRAHVASPAGLRAVRTEVNDERERSYKLASAAKTFASTPHLDVSDFGLAMHSALKDKVAGYIFQVRHNGNLIHTGMWQWAQTPSDQGKGWTVDTRMHVASVSKFLTAVGMVKLLDAKGIDYDTPIIDYLPTYWLKGPKIDQITFRRLLTHKSGFSTGTSTSTYMFMRLRVAVGVPAVGSYDYENMNFGLMRILIPIINGDVSKSAMFSNDPLENSLKWDVVTLYHYRNYMQANVFSPAGVANVQFHPVSGMANALAYRLPAESGEGWNSGNLEASAGGAAWRLSVKELLNVMDHVRRRNTIIPATTAQYMLDNGFGIDQVLQSPAGKMYNKNGSWGADCVTDTNCKTEQSVAYFFPNGIEVAVFVNSPIGVEGFSLRNIVKDSYLNSLSQ